MEVNSPDSKVLRKPDAWIVVAPPRASDVLHPMLYNVFPTPLDHPKQAHLSRPYSTVPQNG